MEKINVITGGKGYVGYALVKELEARGEKMRLLLRSDNGSFEGIPCEKVMGDITNISDLEKAFEGADTVYHVAGLVDITNQITEKVWNVNYEGTKNVVAACKKCGVKTLVYVSSVDAVSVTDDMDIITEVTHFEPDLLEGDYAQSKAAATQYVLDSADENLKVCVVHPSCCIGPYDNAMTSSIGTMIKLYTKGVFAVTFNFGAYNFVDVRDVAKGMVAAAEKGRNGECYFLTGYAHTLDEFMKILAFVCGDRPPHLKIRKDFLMRILPEIEKVFELLKLPPVLNDYSIRKLCENCNFSHEKARRELGYEPMGLLESLQGTVDWYRAHEEAEKEKEAAEKIYEKVTAQFDKMEEKLNRDLEKAQQRYAKKISKLEERARKRQEKIKK